MSSEYKPSLLSRRFLRIVDNIMAEHNQSQEKPMNDSDLSRLLSSSGDRGVIARIKSGRHEPSPKQILKLANEFNIDFNAFYRDVKHIYYDVDLNVSYDYKNWKGEESVTVPKSIDTDQHTSESVLIELSDFLIEWENQLSDMPIKIQRLFGQKLGWMKARLKGVKDWIDRQAEELIETQKKVQIEKDGKIEYMKQLIDHLANQTK